jgi:intracellular sulfur oxidation DsrE/DsrF family protein
MKKSCLLIVILLQTLFTGALAADERKVVLQISDDSIEKQALVLNVADNLIKAYGPRLKLEIVAFGPGLKLLFDENANNTRVQNLVNEGVRFSACRSTSTKMSKLLGHSPKLDAATVMVEGGVGRILELVDQGYTLVKP